MVPDKIELRLSMILLAMCSTLYSLPDVLARSTNVARLFGTTLTMCSRLSLPEVLVQGQMYQGFSWPSWPCAPTFAYLRRLLKVKHVEVLQDLPYNVLQLLLTSGACSRTNVSRFFYDLLDHVLQLLPTWGAGSRTNVSRLSMILLAMCSTLSLPEVLVRGRMCRGSPWPHWPCAPAPPYPARDGWIFSI